MVEGARLESVYTGNCIASSNLAVSAKENQTPRQRGFLFEQSHQACLNGSDQIKTYSLGLIFFESPPFSDHRAKRGNLNLIVRNPNNKNARHEVPAMVLG